MLSWRGEGGRERVPRDQTCSPFSTSTTKSHFYKYTIYGNFPNGRLHIQGCSAVLSQTVVFYVVGSRLETGELDCVEIPWEELGGILGQILSRIT